MQGKSQMLKICEQFSREFSITFNTSKSKLLLFGPNSCEPRLLTMNEKEIPFVLHDKHLGNFIGENSDLAHIDMAIQELYSRVNLLDSQFHYVTADVKYRLFKAYCMSVYGSPLWNFEHVRYIEKSAVAWCKCLKKLLDLSIKTHSNCLYGIINDIPVDTQLHRRFVRFLQSCSTGNLCTELCTQLILHGSQSNACKSLNHIASFYNLNRNALCQCTIKDPTYQINYIIPSTVKDHANRIKDFIEFRDSNRQLYCDVSIIINYLCESDV